MRNLLTFLIALLGNRGANFSLSWPETYLNSVPRFDLDVIAMKIIREIISRIHERAWKDGLRYS
jgi:hypothetical protein